MAFDPSEIVLDPVAFRAWLEEAGMVPVGLACLSDVCPVAIFLGERYGKAFLVTPSSVAVKDGVSRAGTAEYAALPAPGWVPLFVRALDERANFVTGMPIPGRMALEELDKLFPEGFGGEQREEE